jgi:hypothetical protein
MSAEIGVEGKSAKIDEWAARICWLFRVLQDDEATHWRCVAQTSSVQEGGRRQITP